MLESDNLKKKKAKPLIFPSIPTNYPPTKSINTKDTNISSQPSSPVPNVDELPLPPPPDELQEIKETKEKEIKPSHKDHSNKALAFGAVNENIFKDCGILGERTPLNCSETKVSIRYGKRLPYKHPSCQHIQIVKSGCDKCCKKIALNGTLISLHCGWHHEHLYCHRCKCNVENNYQIVNGLFTCQKCYECLKNDHGSKMITYH